MKAARYPGRAVRWHRLPLNSSAVSIRPPPPYLAGPARARGHLRRRHGHEPPAARPRPRTDFGGPELEGCNEVLVETRPDLVAQVHRSFYEVGCDVVETDTFGSTSVVLAEYGLADRARELTRTAAELACAVRDEFATPERPRWVAGSMGPGTKFPTLGPDPLRRVPRRLRGAGARAARGRRRPPAHRDAVRPALGQGRHQRRPAGHGGAGPPCPLQAQVTIELTGRMLPGTEIGAALTVLDAMQVDVVGLNCATGPVEMSEALRHLSGASRVPISCIPNAGLPSVVDGKMHYDLTPDGLAEHLHRFVTEFGVTAIGGCCGTTPDHLAAVVERCAGAVPAARTPGARARRPRPSTPRCPSARTPRSWWSASAPTPTGPRRSARPCSTATGTPASPWRRTRSRRARTSSTSASTTPAPTAWPT